MNKHRSTLLLFEITMMIGIFSLCAAVCISLFTQARLTSQQSRNVSSAAVEAQSAAECFKAAQGNIEHSTQLFGAEEMDKGFFLSYDKDWNTGGDDFMLTLTESTAGEAYILVAEGDKELFSITVKAVHYGQ